MSQVMTAFLILHRVQISHLRSAGVREGGWWQQGVSGSGRIRQEILTQHPSIVPLKTGTTVSGVPIPP